MADYFGLGSAANAIASIANASNYDSSSTGTSVGDSWNSGSSWNNAYSWNSAASRYNAYAQSSSNYLANSYSQTNGTAASYLDQQFANEANAEQWKMNQAQMQYNAEQAQLARDYEEYMSNTAYQRAVRDLMTAGLNPILAVGNMGASTPVGAYASSGLSSAYKANATADSYSSSKAEGSSQSTNKAEGHSISKGESTASGGSSYSGGSHNESAEESNAKSRTQLRNVIEALGGLFQDETSGKRATNGTNNKGGGIAIGNKKSQYSDKFKLKK